MTFDVSLAHEARCVRVTVKGDPKLGRLLSLLQVLEIDTASWTRDAVLVDLRGSQTRLAQDEQAQLAAEAARALRRMKRIAFLVSAGQLRDASGVRVFEDEEAALRWIQH